MIPGTVWKSIGPSPIQGASRDDNGMVTAIATHPSDPDIVYIGTADGGVWRTGDGGGTWQTLLDEEICLAIGEPNAIAIDPGDSDVIYVGTSARRGVSIQRQVGILKSEDGGSSWILLGSGYPDGNNGNANGFANRLVNTIIVDPANSQTVYTATSAGIWVSNDAGQNWARGTGSGGDARSLRLDQTSPAGARILYAGVSGQGVIQSVDGGANWTAIMNSATPSVAALLGGGVSIGQVVIALAPPTSPPTAGGIRVIYATIAHANRNGTPDPIGLFMSTDQGATWTQRAAAGAIISRTFGGYCMILAVDPASPGDGANDILYWGTVSQFRSADSGASFASVSSGLHADTHAWGFFQLPAPATTTIYCGNDGGIFRSTDDGASWTALNSGGFQTTLIYNMDIKPGTTGDVTVAAFQDNGHKRTDGPLGWTSIGGADGWDIVYDGVTADRLLLTRNGNNPATQVFRSIDDGGSVGGVTPWAAGSGEDAFYLASLAADPTNDGVFYVSSNANIWQSLDGGTTWRIIFQTGSGFISPNVAVAPTNGNNVVVANGTQIFVSTNAMAATVGGANGAAFTSITRNLPGRNVIRTVFDPNDETVIYAVLGGFADGGPPGHVFRTTINSTGWTDISPTVDDPLGNIEPVDVPFGAIALDGGETPSTIYVGCDLGVLRSVDRGNTWYVLDDLHFPNAPVTDLVIGRGSNILRCATYGRGVFEFAEPKGPVIAVNLESRFEFGTVCEGPTSLTLQVFNVGTDNLTIKSVQRILGSPAFFIEPFPSTPLVITPGGEVDFTLTYTPSAPGATDLATIRIASNDPESPTVDLLASGVGGTAMADLAIADNGDFGEICLGSFVDRDLVINNSGTCPLEISTIISSSLAFIVPDVVSFPLVISSGGSINLPLRFQPTVLGAAAGTIRVFSNDLESSAEIRVRGTAPAPELDLIIANTGNFGDVCIGSFVDQPLTLLNSGPCTLTVTNVVSSLGEFVVPNVLAYPIRIAPGTAVEMPIRFEPASFGAKVGTITVISDDPTGTKIVAVSGNVPSGKLAVTGSTCIGGVKACCLGERTISICNVGDCKLHVTSVAFKRKSKHWKLINNPFPATLHPGSCLSVLIRYKATEKCPRCCELVITSDDPITPVKILDVMAYTIWSACGCKQCCDDCGKGCCEKRHDECCSAQSLDPCCFDEGHEQEDEDES